MEGRVAVYLPLEVGQHGRIGKEARVVVVAGEAAGGGAGCRVSGVGRRWRMENNAVGIIKCLLFLTYEEKRSFVIRRF